MQILSLVCIELISYSSSGLFLIHFACIFLGGAANEDCHFILDEIDTDALAHATYIQYQRLKRARGFDSEGSDLEDAPIADKVRQPARQARAAFYQGQTMRRTQSSGPRREPAPPVKQAPSALVGSPRGSTSMARRGAVQIKQEPGPTPVALTMQEGKKR